MKSEISKLQNEQAQAEFIGVSSFAVTALVITQILQALFAETQIKTWQLLYISGLILAFLFSLAVRKFLDLGAYLYPVFLYLIISPVFIGDQAGKPWMSIGLVTITANIYFGAFDSWKFGLTSMLAATLLQQWVIQKNPASIADLADMKLLNGYFSITWTLGIGIAAIVIRRNYIKVLETIDGEIREETLRIIGRFQRISKINRSDFRNLKLHSTILNTLIHYRNTGDLKANSQNLARDLDREIMELKNLQVPADLTLNESLERIIKNRLGQRIDIEDVSISGSFKNTQIQENFIEIVRELLLNIEKHTAASKAKIEIEIKDDDKFILKVRENSPERLSEIEILRLIELAQSSKSLQRLIDIFDGELKTNYLPDTSELEHSVIGGYRELEINSDKSILEIRIRGIDNYAMSFAKTTYIFGLIYLPGYFLLNIEASSLVLISLHAVLANLIAFKFQDSKLLLSILTLLSMILFPILSPSVSVCRDTVYFPWLYNIVLANVFIVAFTVKNSYLRWLPLICLSIESVLIPRTFPIGCQGIFVGSLPGIPIIATFAIALILIKKRAVKEDLKLIKRVYEDRNIVKNIDIELEEEYQKILKSLENFRLLTQKDDKSNKELNQEVELEIQRIRTFLFASEQFESRFIRDVYKFIDSKYSQGKLVRLLISGKNFFQYDDEIDWESELAKWEIVFRENPSEINLLSSDNLIVNFRISDVSQEKCDDLTEELMADSGPISYSISNY